MSERVNYKRLCVRSDKDGFTYPKTIAKERGELSTVISIAICLILFLVDLIHNENSFCVFAIQYTTGVVLTIVLQLIYRFILMCEEMRHLISRYDRNVWILFKDVLHFPIPVYMTFFFGVIYLVYNYSSTAFELWNSSVTLPRIVSMYLNMYLLGKLLKLDSGPLNDSLWIAEDNGLDYGSGMAYSFFFGYLNLVLPKTGREDKHLKEIMEDYEGSNGITFAVHKLFILIPKSMKCFVSLKNEYSPSVDESRPLEQKVMTVAGVIDRPYKNSVYKISSEKNDYLYVSAEYATPVKTFYDGLESRQHAENFHKHKKDIILQFYLTLKRVLEQKGLNQFCELIYYEDSYQKDGVTCYYDVGKIIHERIKGLKKSL
ncbi:stimulator of interferon genes protein homolog isoform X2 [Diabrotica virgifera virgifera]|uniref:STING ligand-binding domain-containing protein n=1 Tax=Diabrotica virgifera virgifera TaxID=50390 RepID=A0ABM5JMW0_DIAVI|nr:stimulator of interferon genes protein homolog isoform X2 [Diabrotica virgifera virgifera]